MARQRGNRWQADVIIDGKRQRPSFATQAEAEAYERQIEAGLRPSGKVTLGDFAEEQFTRIWGGCKSQHSIRMNLRVIYRYLPATTLVAEITGLRIDQMVTDMNRDGLANGTINRKLANLSKLLKRAKKLELIPAIPEIERLREAKQREGIWSRDDERKALLFFDHLGLPHVSALLTFLLYTGCRVGEALTLHRKDVHEGHIVFRDTKNGDTRVIPIVPAAAEAWKVICKHSDGPIPFGVLPYWTFRDYWARLRKHMGQTDNPDWVPHMLRHTCCTRMVVSGVPLPAVMKWMGHKSIQVTMRYAHLAPGDLDVAAKALAA
jgi:integrase